MGLSTLTKAQKQRRPSEWILNFHLPQSDYCWKLLPGTKYFVRHKTSTSSEGSGVSSETFRWRSSQRGLWKRFDKKWEEHLSCASESSVNETSRARKWLDGQSTDKELYNGTAEEKEWEWGRYQKRWEFRNTESRRRGERELVSVNNSKVLLHKILK